MNVDQECGLVTGDRAVPLEGVRTEARLTGACVEVTVTQRYRNREAVPVEAVYIFPLDEGAAVCGFAALVSGKLIRGRAEDRDKAFERYDDAMTRGDGAFLLDQERPNVFTASVGNLRPNEAIELQIRYVTLATREGDAIRLVIPTTVSPRYVPNGAPEIGQPDGERVNPEHWPVVPYGLELSVDIDGQGLQRVESPSHAVSTTLKDGGALVSLAHENAALDRDFVLLVEHREPRRPQAKVAREADGSRVAMVTFLPNVAKSADQGHEILFLLDCSGSMAGDEASLDEATKYIERTEADLGGTELLQPLTKLLEARRDEARSRRILVLTDGQVSNEDEVLALARKHADTARIFAFGIGAGASEHLVRGTARASRGAAEMIFPGERIEPKVLRMFERVRMPVFDGARIDWKGLRVEQAPARMPPIFAGEALTVFARVESGTASEVELTVGDERFEVAIDLERAEAGGPLPVLWAREVIRELDDETSRRGSAQGRPKAESRRRARLVELGSRYGLLNSATSYVAVEERAGADQVQSAVALRRIPVALTTGWGGSHGPLLFALASPPTGAVWAKQALFSTFDGEIAEPVVACRMAESPPSSAPAAADRLYDLLMTQRAAGSFVRSSALTAWLGKTRAARLAKAVKRHGESVVVTSTVVLLLEREEGPRESEWRPAVNKAKAWLEKQATAFDASTVLG
jgi:Ca-activated chloride channel family protein